MIQNDLCLAIYFFFSSQIHSKQIASVRPAPTPPKHHLQFFLLATFLDQQPILFVPILFNTHTQNDPSHH